MALFQRCNDVVDIQTTLHQSQNDIVCLLGNVVRSIFTLGNRRFYQHHQLQSYGQRGDEPKVDS